MSEKYFDIRWLLENSLGDGILTETGVNLNPTQCKVIIDFLKEDTKPFFLLERALNIPSITIEDLVALTGEDLEELVSGIEQAGGVPGLKAKRI